MDALKVTNEGKDNKTIIKNIATVCKTLNVPVQWVCKYLSFKMGTTEDFHEDSQFLYINGIHDEPSLRKNLDKFINLYVTCTKCKVPELTYMFSGADETLEVNCKCRACSHQAKMNISDRQMKKIFNLVRPTGVHETMVDKTSDENKSLVKKEKEKVIAKISDQN